MRSKMFLYGWIVCLFVSVNAQTSIDSLISKQFSEGTFGMFGGLSLPTGDFGDEESGAAQIGFLAGVDFTLPFRTLERSGWISSLSVIHNSAKAPSAEMSLFETTVNFKSEAGSWILITPLTGFKFVHEISPDLELYGIGQAGLMIGRSPDITMTIETESYDFDPWTGELITTTEKMTLTQESTSASSFAFSVGAGIVINNNISISLTYLSGKPEYDVEIDSEGWFDITVDMTTKQATSLFQLVAGFNF